MRTDTLAPSAEDLTRYTTDDPGLWPLVSLNVAKEAAKAEEKRAKDTGKPGKSPPQPQPTTLFAPISPTEAPNLFQINLLLKLAQSLHCGASVVLVFRCHSAQYYPPDRKRARFKDYLLHQAGSKPNDNEVPPLTLDATPFPDESAALVNLMKESRDSYSPRNLVRLEEIFSILHRAAMLTLSDTSESGVRPRLSCVVFGESELENWKLGRRVLIEAVAKGVVEPNDGVATKQLTAALTAVRFLTLPNFAVEQDGSFFSLTDTKDHCKENVRRALRQSTRIVRLMNELGVFFLDRKPISRPSSISRPSWRYTQWDMSIDDATSKIELFASEMSNRIEEHRKAWFGED